MTNNLPPVSPNPEPNTPATGGFPPPVPPTSPPPAPQRSAPSPTPPNQRFAVPEKKGEEHHLSPKTILVQEEIIEDEERLIQAKPQFYVRSTWKIAEDRFEKWFVLLLFLVSSLFVLITNKTTGMVWDEAYYVDASERTSNWFASLSATRPDGVSELKFAAQKAEIFRQAWDTAELEPRGHASIPRLLGAIGIRALRPYGIDTLFAMRVPFAFCFGLTLVTLYLLMRKYYGRVTAWITVLAYFFMPHLFGHAHYALTETPSTLFMLLTLYAFLRGLEKKRWALLCGIFFGLALATKATAILLPFMLLPWSLFYQRKKSVNNLYALFFLAPITLVAVWPWLWQNGPAHLLGYLTWNMTHWQTPVYYFDALYDSFNPPVPWNYVPRMIAFTLPLGVLLLATLGFARTITNPGNNKAVGSLLLWAALVPALVQIMPTTPKYDGIRLFHSIFPFIACLAGIGGTVLVRIAAVWNKPTQRVQPGELMSTLLILWIILEGGIALIRIQPYYLSYYNPIGKFLLSNSQAPFQKVESAFWGDSLTPAALETINALVPDGSTLTTRAMNFEVLRYYQKWGKLKPGIFLVEDRMDADFHLLQYRRSFFTAEDWFLVKEQACKRQAVFGPKDTPGIGLYQTGPAYAAYCVQKKNK
jgi:hypothetical protein